MLRPNRCSFMMTTISLIAAILLGSGCATTSPSPPQTYNSELEYLKSLHQAGPVTEPQLVAFLMQQFMNANQQHAGIAFFESFLQKHGGQLSPEQTGLYLSALGVLRASYANQVPLLSRIAWVNETIEILRARAGSHQERILPRPMDDRRGICAAPRSIQQGRRRLDRSQMVCGQHREGTP